MVRRTLLRKPADDSTGVLTALRNGLDTRHEASPVLRLDRVAFARHRWELHILNVSPAGRFDRDLEPLHESMIARGGPTGAQGL
jgi:hypothetical protein